MFGNLGTTELIIILGIVLIFFGAKKIPDLAAGLGKGIRSFKKSLDGDEVADDKKDEKKEDSKEIKS